MVSSGPARVHLEQTQLSTFITKRKGLSSAKHRGRRVDIFDGPEEGTCFTAKLMCVCVFRCSAPNKRNRERVVDCLINICHLRCCNSTIHPAGNNEIIKQKMFKIFLISFSVCFIFRILWWLYPSTETSTVSVKGPLAASIWRWIT